MFRTLFVSYSYKTSFYIVEHLVALGYKREDIEASLAQTRYDDVHATYLLISRKNTDVSRQISNEHKTFRIIGKHHSSNILLTFVICF